MTSSAHRPPAKTYKFKLDAFQQQSVDYIDNNESVLVAAHTSAGKTAIAEYAIATSLRDNQRVIYTSPIKALSNQKYRDLQAEFQDVGLLTGDVTIDPNASCLVMTTEILRSMLYRGSEVMREVAWVVFDEVHYLRDSERGVVWEESIILLPHKVRFVFLSATIPNAQEFASWISHIHFQPCHVVYTDYRPTPLQHYIYCSGGEGMFLVVDEKGKFNEKNFHSAMATLESVDVDQSDRPDGKRKKPRRGGKQADLERIVKMIVERKYDPVIVFSFSKRDCENYALQISKTDLTSEEEKQLISQIFRNAMDSLSDEDKNLPQVQSLLPLLKRGIGIHHGGLLPILKEIVEILFGEGLLKCLFATETFAMGINMPAKTVVFTACTKFDGNESRIVRSGEYIQMSGRAGRRGLDERGIVILMLDQSLEIDAAKGMMSGKADGLTSSFHLGYNMVLNMMRVEDANPEYIVKNSFFVYQREQIIPQLTAKSQELAEQVAKISFGSHKQAVIEYHRLVVQELKCDREVREILRKPALVKKYVSSPGRLVNIDEGWGWGICVGYNDQLSTVDVLACADPKEDKPCTSSIEMDFRVIRVALQAMKMMSTIVLILPKELKSKDNRMQCYRSLKETQRRFDVSGLPLLDVKPTNEADIEALSELHEKQQEVQKLILNHSLSTNPDRDMYLSRRNEQIALEQERAKVEKEIKSIQVMPLQDELEKMRMVLRRLGQLDSHDIIQLKGRVACEVSTCDELLLCELLLGGVFNDLEPAVCAALCSCLVFEEGNASQQDANVKSLKPELLQPYKVLQAAAKRVAEVKLEADFEIDVEEYVDSFKPDIMEVVMMWCHGAKFRQISEATEVFEGSIVRAVRREVELLRQLCSACKVIGDSTLEAKFMKAISLMQRDIMFAASLYL